MKHYISTPLEQLRADLPYLGLALAGIVIVCSIIIPSTSIQLGGRLVNSVSTDQKVVALTLDDGPKQPYTDETLTILSTYDVRATFFLIGVEMERHPEAAKKIVNAGHELGNHSYSHLSLAFMSRARIEKELSVTDRLIRDAGYAGPISVRPPYGHKLITLPSILARQDRPTLMWSIAPDDIPNSDAKEISDFVVSRVRPGSIIVMHTMESHRTSSREALTTIIPTLEKQGYRFVTVSELLNYR